MRLIGLALLVAVLIAAERHWFGQSGARAPHLRRASWPQPDASDPRRFALLVNGGWRPRKNHTRYWNNISLVYRTLLTRGWGTISVLSAGGVSTMPDRAQRSFLGTFAVGSLTCSSPDLDDDGRPEVDGPATRESLRDALSRLGSYMGPGDSLLVFMTDHGQFRIVGGRPRAVAMLWDGEITGEDLDAMLRATIPASAWLAIVAAQCHSVWFLREIHRPNTLLIASGRPLWIWSNQHYSIFPYGLCEALLGEDPVTGEPLEAEGAPGEAVRPSRSLRKAFEVARGRDRAPEWPAMWVNGDIADAPAYF
jgi:hypothetical protein